MKNKYSTLLLLAFTLISGFGIKAVATGEVGDGKSDQWIEDQGKATSEWLRNHPNFTSINEALRGFKSFETVIGFVKEDPNQKCEVTVARKNSYASPFYYLSVYFPASATIQTAYMNESQEASKSKSFSFKNESDGLNASFGLVTSSDSQVSNYQTTTLSLGEDNNALEIEITVTSQSNGYSVSNTPGTCMVNPL